MTHTYSISGMSCDGCRAHVEEDLKDVEGGIKVTVNLEKAEAVIEMESHIPIEKFQEALRVNGGRYGIAMPGEDAHSHNSHTQGVKPQPHVKGSGVYYCPMHCEGEKTYDKPGSCPVCGMDLVEQPSANVEEEDQTYKKLLFKLKISALFTLPVFLIAMSEMIHNNPLMTIMPWKYWNWVQLALS